MTRTEGSLALFRDAEFLALASTAFARSQAYSTIIIALGLYANIFQVSGLVGGLFGTVFALAQFVIVVPLGRAIDLGNSKRYLLLGLLINVAVFVGFSFVGAVEHVLLVRIVQGLGSSLLWLAGSAVVGEISPDTERGLWLGTYNQVGAISSFAGDIFGGALLFLYGFRTTYAVLIVVTLFAFLMLLRYLRDDPGERADPEEVTGLETYRGLLGRSAIRALVFFRTAFSFGKMAVIIFLPIYAIAEFGISELVVGWLMGGGKLIKAALQGKVGDYTDTVGERHHFILAGAFLYAVGTALIPLAELTRGMAGTTLAGFGRAVEVPMAAGVLFAAYAVIGVADSLRIPASMALFVEEGEHFDAVAGSLSLRSIAWKVGQIVGPVAVGAIWDATTVYLAFWTAAAFIVVSTGVFAYLYERDPAPTEIAAAGD